MSETPKSAVPISQPMSADLWLTLGFLSMLWGGSFFFIAIAVREWPPFSIVFARVVIAALVLLAVLAVLRPAFRLDRRLVLSVLGMALFNNVVPFSLIAWAQGHIPSGLASILNATTPLFTVALLHVAGAERATPMKAAGVIVGLGGVALMLARDWGKFGAAEIVPQLAMLLATTSYAISGWWGRRLQKDAVPPLVAATGQMLGSTLLLAPLVLLVDRPWTLPVPSVPAAMAVVALGVFSTALAYILFFRVLVKAGPTNLALVTFLIPVSAILLGTLFLGERLTMAQGFGMATIGLGLALIDGRLIRRRGL
ncbi:MAG: EamA family transporter [Methylobacterium sp.]|nr:MAG: EamA family transporter [Methylobacterium sp.]